MYNFNIKAFVRGLSLTMLLFSFVQSNAQMPGGASGSYGQAPPNLAHVYGKIVDDAGKPIPDASVLILQSRYDSVTRKTKEILFKAQTTKANGSFDLDELPLLGLKLKISAIGYSFYEAPVVFNLQMDPATMPKRSGTMPTEMPAAFLKNFGKDLGSIQLKQQSSQLEGVTITTSTPSLKLEADKKVFNVEKNLVSAGGTAQDVMKNVPSVLVDVDGNVTMRNATPQIYVDGRPTTLQLDQIPADAIQSVEIITNPSAKFDASGGGGGILNIVLKKNRKTGYNGNLRSGVDRRGGLNGGGDFNVRQGKLNVSASVMAMRPKSQTTGYTDRYNFYDTPQTKLYQTNLNKTSGGLVFGKLGLDWFVTDKTTLTIGGVKVGGSFSPTEEILVHTDSLYSSIKTSNYIRTTTTDNTINVNGLQLGMKHLFPQKGHELTADVNYNAAKNTNSSTYLTNFYSTDAYTGVLRQQRQTLDGYGNNKFFTVQTDYTRPLGLKGKLEAGLRASIRDVENNTSNYLYDAVKAEYVLIPSTTNNYTNSDKVYAAYGTYSNVINSFNYQLGLRAESSEYDGTLENTGQKFSNKYSLSLFPSVFLSQKLKSNQELQFNVTRRVNRPTFFHLLPVTDYTDNLNITKGNPELKPEFAYSGEVSYLKTYGGRNSFLASVYYKQTTDLITKYQQKETNTLDGTEALVTTYINADNSYNYGLEMTAQNYITKWWDGSLNVNLYNAKINTENVSGTSQDGLFSYFGKLNNNFKLPKNFTVQLSALYQSKTTIAVNSGGGFGGPGGPPGGGGRGGLQGGQFGQSQTASQGYIKANYGIDLALRKSFLKDNAAAVTLSVNDIFRTRITEQYSYSDYFTQTYSRLRDPQMVRLSLSYRFGKIDTQLFKRKNMKADNGQSATDGIQF